MGDSPKSCSTCEHRLGRGSFARCQLSGIYTMVERQYPTRCGRDFLGWVPRLGVLQRIARFFKGHKP